MACDIARYCLYTDVPPVHVTKRYDDAIRLLIAVRDGLESFGLTDSQGDSLDAPMPVEMRNFGQVFRRDTSGF